MDTCSACPTVRTHGRTHYPLVVALCTPAPHRCPCPGSDSPAACSQHRLQQGLCLGGRSNAPQPLRSHRPCQRGDWARKASSRHWPRRHHGHHPSVGTAFPVPGRGCASCESSCLAQAAWDRPICVGLEVCEPRSPAPSGQAGGTQAWGRGVGSSLPARLPSAPQPRAGHPLAKGGTGRGRPGCQGQHALTPPPREAEGWGDLQAESGDVVCRQAGLGCQD